MSEAKTAPKAPRTTRRASPEPPQQQQREAVTSNRYGSSAAPPAERISDHDRAVRYLNGRKGRAITDLPVGDPRRIAYALGVRR